MSPFLLFSQAKEVISINNINDKIIEAYNDYEKYDKQDVLFEVLTYTALHDVRTMDQKVLGRLYYIESIKAMHAFDYAESKKTIQKALVIAKENDDKNLIGAAYQVLATLEYVEQDIGESIRYTYAALKIFNNTNADYKKIDAHYSLSKIYHEMESWDESNFHAQKSIDLIKKIGIKEMQLKYLYSRVALNDIYLNKDSINIINNLEIAQSLTKENYINSQNSINLAYARFYERNERYEKANKYFEKIFSTRTLNEKIENINVIKSTDMLIVLNDEVNRSKDVIISNHKLLLTFSVVFLIITILYILRIIFLAKSIKNNIPKIKSLNRNLNEANLILKEKNVNVNSLLSLNERTLFSKILKISTYYDVINKLGDNVSRLIESEGEVDQRELVSIEKTLKTMINEDEIWNEFQVQFEETRPDFFKELKKVAPNLSINDLKHCSYIIAKLKAKEVADLIKISTRSVETTRYRINKKIGLDKSQTLFEFLQKL